MAEAKNFVLSSFRSNIGLALPNCPNGLFSFRPTTSDIIKKYVNSLDDLSSAGVSGIPVRILKESIDGTARFLCQLYNDSVAGCCFPDEFKFALVTSLFKGKGSQHDMNSYRGISVLPPIAKVFEKIMAEQIRIHLSIRGLLFVGQHGFRESHSCETALHEIISSCLKNLDNKLVNLLLFIDFKKAFDMISPDLLLLKLVNYGFTNQAIGILSDYFKNVDNRSKSVTSSPALGKSSLGSPKGQYWVPFCF